MKQNRDGIGLARLATFVAALALILQSALAIASPPVERDIFGNAICADGSGHTPSDGDRAGHTPDCCLLTCNMGISAAEGPPPETTLPVVAATTAVIVHPQFANVRQQDRRTPSNPRAPPFS